MKFTYLNCGLKNLINERPHLSYARNLSTVPPYATAHTFCVSRDGPRTSYFLRKMPSNSKIFLAFCDSGGKEYLSKGY